MGDVYCPGCGKPLVPNALRCFCGYVLAPHERPMSTAGAPPKVRGPWLLWAAIAGLVCWNLWLEDKIERMHSEISEESGTDPEDVDKIEQLERRVDDLEGRR